MIFVFNRCARDNTLKPTLIDNKTTEKVKKLTLAFNLFIRTFTHADGNRVSTAIIRVSVYVILSVCLSAVSVRMVKPKRMKLQSPQTGIVHHDSRVFAIHLILGQKVKGQGHKVEKRIEANRVAGVSYALVPGLYLCLFLHPPACYE